MAVVENFMPPPSDGPIGPGTAVSFDVVNDTGEFQDLVVLVYFPGTNLVEVAWDGTSFTPFYNKASSVASTAVGPSIGFHFVLIRASGWVSAPAFSIHATDIAAGEGPMQRVLVNALNSPFAARSGYRHIIDLSLGRVDLLLQSGVASGIDVAVKILVGPMSNIFQVHAPTPSGEVEQSLEEAGAGSVFAATATFHLDGELGSSFTWECDGSNNWEIVT